jgi:predicted component of type VI protein secretion system
MKFLFDRLCFPRGESALSATEETSSLIKSVSNEIARITSQKQYFEGFSKTLDSEQTPPSVLSFGISRGVGEPLNHDSAKALALEIKKVILANEPRLLAPQVYFKPGKAFGGRLAFEVAGQLRLGDELIRYNKHFAVTGAEFRS